MLFQPRPRPRGEFLNFTEAEGGRGVLFWPRSITEQSKGYIYVYFMAHVLP